MSAPAPTPTPASSGAEVVSALRLAAMRLARRLRQQGDSGITPSQMSALTSIERLGPVPLGELAAVERVQPPTMTRLVARLEDLGLVAREADPEDRRVSRVRLKDAGRRHLTLSRTRKDAYLTQRLQRFEPHERALLEQVLPLLERLAAEEEPAAPTGEAPRLPGRAASGPGAPS